MESITFPSTTVLFSAPSRISGISFLIIKKNSLISFDWQHHLGQRTWLLYQLRYVDASIVGEVFFDEFLQLVLVQLCRDAMNFESGADRAVEHELDVNKAETVEFIEVEQIEQNCMKPSIHRILSSNLASEKSMSPEKSSRASMSPFLSSSQMLKPSSLPNICSNSRMSIGKFSQMLLKEPWYSRSLASDTSVSMRLLLSRGEFSRFCALDFIKLRLEPIVQFLIN
jgi:hypothetical protein